MSDATPKIHFVNALLLAGVLVTTTMMTCSNDRLEQKVIKLQQAVETGAMSAAPQAPATTHVAADPKTTGGDGTAKPAPVETRVPGAESPVTAVGWGGRSAKVLYVEGAVPDAPLRIQDKPRPQNDWYVQQWASPAKSLNYYCSNEGEMGQVVRGLILQSMFMIDPDHPPGVTPMLATHWEVSDDKLTYTFHLRKGVQFADGRPMTSADVKYSFDVIRDTEVQAAQYAPNFEDVVDLSTPDPYTVVAKYAKKYWKGIYSVGFILKVLDKGWYDEQIPVYAKKLGVEKFSIEPGKPGFGTVFRKILLPCPGTGPYYIASEDDVNQDRIIERQNPFYYGIQVHPEWWNFLQIRRLYIKDPVATDEAFRKQEFDVMSVGHERWEKQLKTDPVVNRISNHYLYDHTGIDGVYICWNCRQPPFDDKRVRQAMTMLLDRPWILKELYCGNGTIAVCKSKRNYATYSNDIQPWPFDVDRAKQALAEAGWKDTDGDGVLDKDGKRFEFVLKAPASPDPFLTRIAGAFKDACQKAGIRVDVQTSEWSTFIEDFELRRFDGAMLGNSWSDPWIDLYEDYHSSQDVPRGNNASGWRDARVDVLLEKMREEFDEGKRTEMFHEFNKLFFDAQPQTLFVHPLVSVCLNKRFENVTIRPTGLQFFDMWVKPENVLHK
jgi:peptide/nickel transport system substrate-binding protein